MTSNTGPVASTLGAGEPVKELRPEAKELLEKYVGVPDSEMLAHVEHMRAKAWQTCPYPCVGLSAFTRPTIQLGDMYSDVLKRLQDGQKLLDLGCGFGQNIRKLVFDGAPAENVSGADISQVLIDCGYEYFKDGTKLKSKFIIGDVFDSESSAYAEAKEQFDMVYASMVYHLWGWDDQVQACVETIKLMKPVAGSMLFGWQLGATPAGEITRVNSIAEKHKKMYQHDEESWKRMWKEIGEKTGTEWDIRVKSVVTPELKANHGVFVREASTLTGVFFVVTRL